MKKASKQMLREFVNSQSFTSTTDIMNSMNELYHSDAYMLIYIQV